MPPRGCAVENPVHFQASPTEYCRFSGEHLKAGPRREEPGLAQTARASTSSLRPRRGREKTGVRVGSQRHYCALFAGAVSAVPGKAQSRQRVSAGRQRLSRMQSFGVRSFGGDVGEHGRGARDRCFWPLPRIHGRRCESPCRCLQSAKSDLLL